MKTIAQRLGTLFSVVTLASLVAAPVAAAGEPVITVVEVDRTSISAPLSRQCGYPVQARIVGAVRTITFVDDTGAPVRKILTAPGGISTTYTNLNTGESLEVFHPFTEHFELQEDGTWIGVFAGLRQLVVIPGEGVIRVWAGHWEFLSDSMRRVFLPYIEESGVNIVDMTLCEALSPATVAP